MGRAGAKARAMASHGVRCLRAQGQRLQSPCARAGGAPSEDAPQPIEGIGHAQEAH